MHKDKFSSVVVEVYGHEGHGAMQLDVDSEMRSSIHVTCISKNGTATSFSLGTCGHRLQTEVVANICFREFAEGETP